jgi:hypothetical protein
MSLMECQNQIRIDNYVTGAKILALVVIFADGCQEIRPSVVPPLLALVMKVMRLWIQI